MGHTVVFTVPLDPDDDVGIATVGSRPGWRDHFLAQWAQLSPARRWRLAVLVVALSPIIAGSAQRIRGVPTWFGTVVVGVAALAALVACGALGASIARVMPDDAQLRDRLGIAAARLSALWVGGAALTVATGPAVAWAAFHEQQTESQVTPLVVTLLVVDCAAVAMGAAVSVVRLWRHPLAVGAASAVVLALAPVALFVAAVPAVSTTDSVVRYAFTTGVRDTGGLSLPAYQCGKETVVRYRAHTERSAWLLMISPLAAIADAPVTTASELANAEPGSLALVQAGLRSTRVGPDAFSGYCYQPTSLGVPNAVREARYQRVESIGLAVALGELAAFAFAALVVVSRRRRQ